MPFSLLQMELVYKIRELIWLMSIRTPPGRPEAENSLKEFFHTDYMPGVWGRTDSAAAELSFLLQYARTEEFKVDYIYHQHWLDIHMEYGNFFPLLTGVPSQLMSMQQRNRSPSSP